MTLQTGGCQRTPFGLNPLLAERTGWAGLRPTCRRGDRAPPSEPLPLAVFTRTDWMGPVGCKDHSVKLGSMPRPGAGEMPDPRQKIFVKFTPTKYRLLSEDARACVSQGCSNTGFRVLDSFEIAFRALTPPVPDSLLLYSQGCGLYLPCQL